MLIQMFCKRVECDVLRTAVMDKIRAMSSIPSEFAQAHIKTANLSHLLEDQITSITTPWPLMMSSLRLRK